MALLGIMRQLKAVAALRCEPGTAVFLLHHMTVPRRVSDLATCAGLDTSTVSRHVKALEDAGLLSRAEDPADRRAWRLEITPAGRELLVDTRRAWADFVGGATVDWSAADRAALTNLMTRLAGSMDRLAAEMENG